MVPRSASQASNGPGDGAGRVEDELQARGEVVVVHDRDAADHVAVAVQVLGGGVVDDVRAEARADAGRRAMAEGVVDDEQRPAPLGDLGRRRARSVIRISGLVGVSTITAASSGVIASAMRCGSRVST